MFKNFVSIVIAFLSVLGVSAQELKSPNGNFKMKFALENNGTPTYQLFLKDKEVIKKSKLGLELQKEKKSLLDDFTIVEAKESSFYETWKPVWGEETSIKNK